VLVERVPVLVPVERVQWSSVSPVDGPVGL